MTGKNRETYLNQAITQFRPLFKRVNAPIPAPEKLRVTCGFPSKSAGRSSKQRIGECWSSNASADGTTELIVSMVLDDDIRVLDVLCHELIHAAVGNECGHRGEFKRVAVALGMEGIMTATIAGAELRTKLEAISKKLGAYSHAAIDFSNRKKQTTRMIKVTCKETDGCGMIFRTSATWIAFTGGELSCPSCGEGTVIG